MQRLSLEILNRMFCGKLTRCEISFLLCVSRYQDKGGQVKGAYYKEISREMGCSYPCFYAAMRSLEGKGFIRLEKNSYFDYDITINGNDYRTNDIYADGAENARRKPYINTRHEIFYKPSFRKMKPGAQLMAMDFMGVARMGGGTYRIRVGNFFAKYQGLLGVTARTVRVYITQLKEFFSIGIKDGKYWVRPKAGAYRDGGNTEADNYNEQQIRMVCRRNRIEAADEKEVGEVRTLVRQYGKKAAAAGRDALATVLEAVRLSVPPAGKCRDGKPALESRLVHMWVKRLLGACAEKEQREGISVPKKGSFHNFHQREYDWGELEKALLSI